MLMMLLLALAGLESSTWLGWVERLQRETETAPEPEPAMDDCASSPCQNGGGCVEGDAETAAGVYVCECASGYTGEHCDQAEGAAAPDHTIGVVLHCDLTIQRPLAAVPETSRSRIWLGTKRD